MLHPKILAYCQEDVVDIRGFDRCELHEAEEGRSSCLSWSRLW